MIINNDIRINSNPNRHGPRLCRLCFYKSFTNSQIHKLFTNSQIIRKFVQKLSIFLLKKAKNVLSLWPAKSAAIAVLRIVNTRLLLFINYEALTVQIGPLHGSTAS